MTTGVYCTRQDLMLHTALRPVLSMLKSILFSKGDHVRIIKAMLIVTALFLVPASAFSSNLGYMRISLIGGDVQVKTPEAGDWGLASINGPLEEGDQIWVPEGGRVELQLNTGTYIRLDQNSALQILSMDKDSSQLYFSQGHAYIYFNAPSGSVIQVDTPDASTRAFGSAIFRIDMSDQYQYTDVAVYKGYVETENEVGKARINVDEMLSVGQNTNGEVAPLGPADEWEKWNKGRNDRLLAKREMSSRYLPDALSVYSADLDDYGRWVQVPDYGYVWTPTGVVVDNWAPYRHGRWIWRDGEYIWVGNEPWGWAPYHYGRWAFVNGVGWCWVPPVRSEVYWGPGYVGWVRTGDYVAWVPLAPRETYYGRGYYGPYSVNITNVNVTQVNVTNVYKNVYVNNGVTVVNRNTFNTASPSIVNVHQNIIQQNIFTKNNISVRGPEVKPSKASYFASAKQIPPAKLPPQPIRNVQVTQLKQSRPFIKEANKSVLTPGVRPQILPVNNVTTRRTPGKGIPTIQPVQLGGHAVPSASPPKGERPQMKLPERNPRVPQGGSAPKVDTPPERKPAVPVGAPAPKAEKPQVKPPERKPAAPVGGPTPKEEKKPAGPAEKKKPEEP